MQICGTLSRYSRKQATLLICYENFREKRGDLSAGVYSVIRDGPLWGKAFSSIREKDKVSYCETHQEKKLCHSDKKKE